VTAQDDRTLALEHVRDGSRYTAVLKAAVPVSIARPAPHEFQIAPAEGALLDFTLSYSAGAGACATAESAAALLEQSALHWQAFWRSGAAVDFTGSTDPRAAELERRVVLSQYLTAIQFGGDFPPQESGLTTTTWYGKHHTEMVWWHAAHFALWGRPQYLANTLRWFQTTLPVARQIAQSRGLKGARWPKMTGPQGRDSPGGNPLIVWNQPHPIHLAELMYRSAPDQATLERYRELVFATADAMASMLHWDAAGKRYVLGPPLWIAQEIYDQSTSMNPAYELSYWATGLQIAQQWRARLGLPPDADWEQKRLQLSKLPTEGWQIRGAGIDAGYLGQHRQPPRSSLVPDGAGPVAWRRRGPRCDAAHAGRRAVELGLAYQDLGLGLSDDRHDRRAARRAEGGGGCAAENRWPQQRLHRRRS
jgi:hypothetical protein